MKIESFIETMAAALEQNPNCGWLWIADEYGVSKSAALDIYRAGFTLYQSRVNSGKANWEQTVKVPEHHKFRVDLLYSDFEDVETVGNFKNELNENH